MSVVELFPTIQSLPRAEKEQLYRFLADELARPPESVTMLKPEDRCPYTPDELATMRREEGGRTLAEIWRSLGRT
jgi:hypothetical protein